MPTTTGIATEFIQFSRPGATGGGATVTDSDGFIKWAPHNLLLNSESFASSPWTTYLATIAPNDTVAPNGTTTADKYTYTGAGSSIYYDAIVPIGTHTASCFFKLGTIPSTCTLSIASVVGNGIQATFNLSTISASVAILGTGGTASGGSAAISSVGNGWFLCTLSGVATAGTNAVLIGFNGSSSQTGYIWGASLYRSDLAMQPNASAYPLYNPTTPKNLLGYTENFASAGWQKLNIATFGSGSISNAIAAPNGLQTADKVVANTTSGEHFIYQTITGGGKNTFSIYLKASEYYLARIIEISAYRFYATVNLLTGAITNSGGANLTFAGATDVGNGWWRCEIEHSSSASCAYSVMGFPDTITPTNSPANYTGDGISGIYLWGAQLSDSASLDTYVPSYDAAPTSAAYYGPRRDFNGSTLACRGLLVEEQRTNLFLYSDQFDNTSYWTTTGVITAGMANAAVAPTGTSVADAITEDTSTGVHRIYGPVTLAASTYTLSFYAKANGRNWIYIYVDGGITAGTLNFVTNTYVPSTGTATVSSVLVGNSWYRVTYTFSNTLTSSQNLQLWLATDGTTISYTGNGTSGIYLFGAQVELGSFATSYIPTGSAVGGATRGADYGSVSAQAFPYNSTEGTLVVQSTIRTWGSTGYPTHSSLNDGTGSNLIVLYHTNSGATAAEIYTSGAQEFTRGLGTVSDNATIKMAIAYKSDSTQAARDGTVSTVDTSTPIPPVSKLDIGQYANSARLNGWVRQITYIPRRISSSELQTRTS